MHLQVEIVTLFPVLFSGVLLLLVRRGQKPKERSNKQTNMSPTMKSDASPVLS